MNGMRHGSAAALGEARARPHGGLDGLTLGAIVGLDLRSSRKYDRASMVGTTATHAASASAHGSTCVTDCLELTIACALVGRASASDRLP